MSDVFRLNFPNSNEELGTSIPYRISTSANFATMIRNAVVAILCFLSYQVTCFSPLSELKSFQTINTDSLQTKFNAAALAGIATASSAVTPALAVDSYEVADLPPPYIPVIFGLGLLVGVGLLTGSLGDIMSEEASLGMLSGAQAKKEMQRSKSSYFKKR